VIRRLVSAGAVASALVILVASTGAAAVGTLTRVSSPPSPYAAACASNDASQPGHVYVNGTEEPQLAVNGSNMIAMWHQDRWNNGGAHGIGVGYSTSGGQSWAETTIAWDACSGADPQGLGQYFRNSDPWVSFGPDGVAYASALAFNILSPNNANAVVVGTSTDGGQTWGNLKAIRGSAFPNAQNSTDKNSTTADPVTDGTAYTVWDTLTSPTDNPDDRIHAAAYSGPAYFSKTKDGGQTWSDATVMFNSKNRQQTIGNIIVVDPRTTPHTLYDFFDDITTPNTPFQGTRTTEEVAFVKSTDGGSTWSQAQIIAPFNSLGVVDPNTGAPLRVGDGLQEVARDSSTGALYVVWESSSNYQKQLKQSTGAWDDEILLVSSTDGGATWSPPQSIDIGNNGLPAFTPTVAANNGRVAVTYYDSRNLQSNQKTVMPTDYWARVSDDGGATFGIEQRLTSVSFDVMSAPVARGFFLGDYEGLQPSGSGFEALFVKTNCNATDSTDTVFTGSCGPASSNTAPNTTNTDPTDVFSIAIS
jgi:hypothetical protein